MTNTTWIADIEGLSPKQAQAAQAQRDRIRASRRAAQAEVRASWQAKLAAEKAGV